MTTKALKKLGKAVSQPADFLAPKKGFADGFLPGLQQLFVQCKATEPEDCQSPLNTLLVDGFDPEQVWEQIQLLNEPTAAVLKTEAARLLDVGRPKLFVPLNDDEGESAVGYSAEEEENDEDESDDEQDNASGEDLGPKEDGAYSSGDDGSKDDPGNSGDEDALEDSDADSDDGGRWGKKGGAHKKKKPGPRLDSNGMPMDDFFSVGAMKAFLDAEDSRDARKQRKKREGPSGEEDDFSDEDDIADADNEVDLFAELDSGDSDDADDAAGNDAMYGAFFDPLDGAVAGRKPGTNGLFDDADDGEEEEEKLSKYEKQQQRIQSQIDELEEFNASDKPWQLKGEVGGGARPMDSLLQEDLDFDVMTRPAPEITEETTVSLEDMIIQRIKDSAYDDVERKDDPKNMAAYQPKDRIELDGDKSKVGLGELYEDDFQRQASGPAATAAEEKVGKQHAEIETLLGTLNTQLNALTNFHFTPQSVNAEVVVQTNAPAITLEEAQPTAGSTASQMAPEEIYGKSKGENKGDSEKTTTDKKRERRAKKKLKHTERLDRERKQKAKGLAGTVTKAGALAKLAKQSNVTVIEGTSQSGSSSSKKFFNALSEVGDGKGKGKKKKDDSATTGSKLRL
eukprot:gene8489-8876_t